MAHSIQRGVHNDEISAYELEAKTKFHFVSLQDFEHFKREFVKRLHALVVYFTTIEVMH